MSVQSAEIKATLTVVESPDNTNTLASGSTLTHSALNQSHLLSGSTTPPVTTPAGRNDFALSGGAASIDFTAIRGSGGANKDFTGLKVQSIVLKNKATNTGPMTFTEGASNGLALCGPSFSFRLQPGQWCQFFFNDASPDVASGDRTIDVSGTGTEQFEIFAVAG